MFHLLHPYLRERRDDTTGVAAGGDRCRRRGRADRVHRGAGGRAAPLARVWVTTVDRAELLHERAPVAFGPAARHATDHHGRPEPRRTRRWTASAPRSPTRRPPCSTGSPRPRGTRRCARCSTRRPAIGVSFLRQPIGSSDFTAAAQHYTYDDMPAGQTDFALRALQHRPRPGADPAAAAPGQAAQPAAEGHGHAVEPAGVDEDQRLARRRPAQGRPGDLPRLRPLPGRSSSRPTRAAGRADRLPHRAERAAEPDARTATRARTCRSPQEVKVIEALGPMLRAASPRTKILGLRPQLGRPPQRRRPTPRPAQDPETDYPYETAATARPRGGSPAPPTTATTATRARRPRCTTRSRTRASGSPSAPARTAPTDTPAQYLPRHAELARPQPHHRHHPQLGEVGGQLEHRARLDRRPAHRRLRHLHRPGHRQPRRHGHHQRRVLHDRPPRRSSCSPARSASPARRSAPPAGTARSWTWRSATRTARRRWSCTTRTTTRGPSRSPSAARSFDYTLPGGALATFTWPASQALGTACGSCPLDAARPRPRRRPAETPTLAIDDDASTRWSSGQAQAAGPVPRRSTWAGARRSAGSPSTAAATSATTPAAWQLRRQQRRHRLARRSASGAGTGQLTNVDVPPDPGPIPAGDHHRRRPATGGASPTCALRITTGRRGPPAPPLTSPKDTAMTAARSAGRSQHGRRRARRRRGLPGRPARTRPRRHRANVWLTTPDRANLLTQKSSVAVRYRRQRRRSSPSTRAPRYQSMVGFGASLTDCGAYIIYNSSARNTS